MSITATLTPMYEDEWNFDPFNLTWANGTLTVSKTSSRKFTPALERLIELIETDSDFQFIDNADPKKVAKALGLPENTEIVIDPLPIMRKIKTDADFYQVLISRKLDGQYSVEFANSQD